MSTLFRKSFLAVAAAALLSLSLTACDGGEDTATESTKPAEATSPTNGAKTKPGGG